MGLVIGWVSCTFMWNNGENSCYILLNFYIMQFVIWCHPFNFFVKVQNGKVANMPWLIIFQKKSIIFGSNSLGKGVYLYIEKFDDYVWTCTDTSKCTNQDKKIINTFGAKLVNKQTMG
jgi:hypothetical protein